MSDTISGIDSSLYINNATNNNATANSIENTLTNTDLSTASEDELMSVCKDFEEYFVEQMVKSMIKMASVNGSDDENDYSSIFGLSSESSDSALSTMSSFYGDQMVTQLSEALCSDENGNGIGLAQTLYEQMKRNYNISDAADNTDSSTDTVQ